MSNITKLMKTFDRVCKDADAFNSKTRSKRLVQMTHGHNNRLTEIGIYDSKTKKYAVTDIRAFNAEEVMMDIEGIVNSAYRS